MGHAALKSKEKALEKRERKFEKKQEFYSKVKDTVATKVAASLRAKSGIGKKKNVRRRQKKVKSYDFSSLADVLPELKDLGQQDTSNLKLNSRRRQKLVEKEGKQFKSVVSNPIFQLDPLAAIHQHLEHTQHFQFKSVFSVVRFGTVFPEEKPKKKPNKCGSKKGKKSKAQSVQGMEF